MVTAIFLLSDKTKVGACRDFEQRIYWTDQGLCIAINAIPMDQVYVATDLSRLYDEVFETSHQDKTYFNASATGDIFSVQVVTNMNTVFAKAPYKKAHDREDSLLSIAMNDFKSPFDVFFPKTKIGSGSSKLIQMSPTVIKATEDLRSLDIMKRKCKFQDEADGLQLFK